MLLHSRLNHLVQTYNFGRHPSDSSALVSTSDPSVLEFNIGGPGRTTQIQMEFMQYGETGQGADGSGLGCSYINKGIQFFRLFSAQSDLSVYETVVYTQALRANAAIHSDIVVKDFERSLIRHTRRNVSRKEVIVEDDDFVVPNGLDAVESPKSKIPSQAPKVVQHQDLASFQGELDYRLLYSALIRIDASDERASGSVDIAIVTNRLHQMLMNEPGSTALPLGTL